MYHFSAHLTCSSILRRETWGFVRLVQTWLRLRNRASSSRRDGLDTPMPILQDGPTSRSPRLRSGALIDSVTVSQRGVTAVRTLSFLECAGSKHSNLLLQGSPLLIDRKDKREQR